MFHPHQQTLGYLAILGGLITLYVTTPEFWFIGTIVGSIGISLGIILCLDNEESLW